MCCCCQSFFFMILLLLLLWQFFLVVFIVIVVVVVIFVVVSSFSQDVLMKFNNTGLFPEHQFDIVELGKLSIEGASILVGILRQHPTKHHGG